MHFHHAPPLFVSSLTRLISRLKMACMPYVKAVLLLLITITFYVCYLFIYLCSSLS